MDENSTPLLPATDVVAGTAGSRYILFQDTDHHGISQSIRNKGSYESNLHLIATALLQANPGPGCVLDVGANLGSFTVPMARQFGHLRFECFEIQRPVYYQLCGNIVLNRLHNVIAHQIGLGAAASEIEVALPQYAQDINIGSFSLDGQCRQAVRGGDFAGEKVRIQLINLDSLYLQSVRLIKMDVEGMELDVLLGATGTLVRSGFPPIIYEAWAFDWYAPHKARIERHLGELGYIIANFDGSENFIAQHPKFGQVLVKSA